MQTSADLSEKVSRRRRKILRGNHCEKRILRALVREALIPFSDLVREGDISATGRIQAARADTSRRPAIARRHGRVMWRGDGFGVVIFPVRNQSRASLFSLAGRIGTDLATGLIPVKRAGFERQPAPVNHDPVLALFQRARLVSAAAHCVDTMARSLAGSRLKAVEVLVEEGGTTRGVLLMSGFHVRVALQRCIRETLKRSRAKKAAEA